MTGRALEIKCKAISATHPVDSSVAKAAKKHPEIIIWERCLH